MLCEKCRKNKATTYCKTTVNGVTEEICLCPECAEKSGLNGMIGDTFFSDPFFDSFFGDSFFEGLPRLAASFAPKKCPECGTTVNDILRYGKVGCPGCYDAFEKELQGVILRAQGSVKHLTGEDKENIEKHAEELRQEMKKAIEAEDFEKAAKLRDEIRGMEA